MLAKSMINGMSSEKPADERFLLIDHIWSAYDVKGELMMNRGATRVVTQLNRDMILSKLLATLVHNEGDGKHAVLGLRTKALPPETKSALPCDSRASVRFHSVCQTYSRGKKAEGRRRGRTIPWLEVRLLSESGSGRQECEAKHSD